MMRDDGLSPAELEAEERAVLATLQGVLDALARRDQAAMAALLLPGGGATHSRDDTFFHLLLRDFPERVTRGEGAREERIHDPEIRIDGDIAMIWAPYDFYIDGRVHHWGTNIVTLLKRDGRWRISGIADNGRTTPRPAE
jgi:putative lumazine-binding protein